MANLLACGISQAASISHPVEGAWVGATTSISTGETTPTYGFILATGEYFFITDKANPEITLGTSIISAGTILSTDMKTYTPQRGTIVNGWFTGTLTSDHSMSIQFLRNNSGAASNGNFTLDAKYKVPSSLTIITGTHANQHHLENKSMHNSHTFDANAISTADSAECAAKELLIIVLAPKISITCR